MGGHRHTHELARYNVHKRATMDRISLRYQLQTREVVRGLLADQVRDIRDALDADKRTYKPPAAIVSRARDRLKFVIERHRDDVVRVGVSDGIREVTPDRRLDTWNDYPVLAPIEDTFRGGTELASARDKITAQIRAKFVKDPKRYASLLDALMDSWLTALRRTYTEIGKDWLEGESGSTEVRAGLSIVLQKNDYEAARIFRTETTNYFNRSRFEYFDGHTDVDYMQLYAVTDGRISNICEARHEAVVPIARAHLRQYMPAFHPHCRTIQRPLISALSTHKSIIERGLELLANESSWPPLPKHWGAIAA
jgi:SPP1 gp7 family putative phage head morphogenesis protein